METFETLTLRSLAIKLEDAGVIDDLTYRKFVSAVDSGVTPRLVMLDIYEVPYYGDKNLKRCDFWPNINVDALGQINS